MQNADAGNYTVLFSNSQVFVPQTMLDPKSFDTPAPIICFDLIPDMSAANTNQYDSNQYVATLIFMHVVDNTTARYDFTYTQIGLR